MWWSNLIGQAINGAQNANVGGLSQSANQLSGAANAAHQGMSPSQLAAQQYNIYMAQAQMVARPSPRWMFDGELLNFDQFVERVYPEDSPEKTAFLLKHSGKE